MGLGACGGGIGEDCGEGLAILNYVQKVPVYLRITS